MPVDRGAAERAVEAFLRAIGHDPDGERDLSGTPARVAAAWLDELLAGERVDAATLLTSESGPSDATGVVSVRRIAVTTVCPHHLLPARGTATVAYLPGGRLAGIGTLARLVHANASRLTLQEDIGERVVRALVSHLGARGAACQLVLAHDCLSSRGEREHDARVETLALQGDDAACAELRALVGVAP